MAKINIRLDECEHCGAPTTVEREVADVDQEAVNQAEDKIDVVCDRLAFFFWLVVAVAALMWIWFGFLEVRSQAIC